MKKILRIILSVAVVSVAVCTAVYLADYYHNTDANALAGTDNVDVIRNGSVTLFDGPGSDTAMIFYPGGKVEDTAYCDLLKQIAAGGVDCFLADMPCHLAFFGYNKAGDIIEDFGSQYSDFYISGHSLGGVAACMYVKKNPEKLKGIVLLASYSSKDISDLSLDVLSVYGDKDEVINRESLENNKVNLPENASEYIIYGGNHSGFGTYGEQKGDGAAEINGEKQRAEAAKIILEFIGE